MAKITISDIGSGFSLSKINDAFQQIEDALNNDVLWRDNPTGEVNYMNNDLDMNTYDILNAGTIQAANFVFSDGSNLNSILDEIYLVQEEVEKNAVTATAAAEAASISEVNAKASEDAAAASAAVAAQSEVNALTYKIQAASSAADAQIQAQAAEQYSLLGLSANTTAFDLGYVSDPVVIFPTDLGVLP